LPGAFPGITDLQDIGFGFSQEVCEVLVNPSEFEVDGTPATNGEILRQRLDQVRVGSIILPRNRMLPEWVSRIRKMMG